MPSPDATDYIFASEQAAKEEFFFRKKLGPDEVLWLPNPNDITASSAYLQRLGIYLTGISYASKSPFVVETYYTCHGMNTTRPVVTRGTVGYKSQLEDGLYLYISYDPENFDKGNGLKPIFTNEPMNFSSVVSVRMGSRMEKQYLALVKKQPEYHIVPNAFGTASS